MKIRDYLQKEELGLQAGLELQAGVRENFKTGKDGAITCKHCGDTVPHPRAAAAHLAVHHREKLEAVGGKIHSCDACGKKFMSASGFQAHLKGCSGKKK